MTACTPIDENRTLTTHMMWWSLSGYPYCDRSLCHSSRSFLAQDQAVFAKQAKGLRWDPDLRLTGQPDQLSGILGLRMNGKDRQKAGKPFKNPLTDSTLCWRS